MISQVFAEPANDAPRSGQETVLEGLQAGIREGEALGNLGRALRSMRRFAEAIAAYQGALATYRETGDQYRAGIALNNLEAVHDRLI